ncbi:hypothetical protein HDU76_000242 [Blyttiomyces sp. JEL0837]|nr:hypothetical protein HDU76_000242 [Blyttiomyces sp. JEL0837]
MDLIQATLTRLEFEKKQARAPATLKKDTTRVDKSNVAAASSTRGTSPKKAPSKAAGTLKPTPLQNTTVPVVENVAPLNKKQRNKLKRREREAEEARLAELATSDVAVADVGAVDKQIEVVEGADKTGQIDVGERVLEKCEESKEVGIMATEGDVGLDAAGDGIDLVDVERRETIANVGTGHQQVDLKNNMSLFQKTIMRLEFATRSAKAAKDTRQQEVILTQKTTATGSTRGTTPNKAPSSKKNSITSTPESVGTLEPTPTTSDAVVDNTVLAVVQKPEVPLKKKQRNKLKRRAAEAANEAAGLEAARIDLTASDVARVLAEQVEVVESEKIGLEPVVEKVEQIKEEEMTVTEGEVGLDVAGDGIDPVGVEKREIIADVGTGHQQVEVIESEKTGEADCVEPVVEKFEESKEVGVMATEGRVGLDDAGDGVRDNGEEIANAKVIEAVEERAATVGMAVNNISFEDLVVAAGQIEQEESEEFAQFEKIGTVEEYDATHDGAASSTKVNDIDLDGTVEPSYVFDCIETNDVSYLVEPAIPHMPLKFSRSMENIILEATLQIEEEDRKTIGPNAFILSNRISAAEKENISGGSESVDGSFSTTAVLPTSVSEFEVAAGGQDAIGEVKPKSPILEAGERFEQKELKKKMQSRARQEQAARERGDDVASADNETINIQQQSLPNLESDIRHQKLAQPGSIDPYHSSKINKQKRRPKGKAIQHDSNNMDETKDTTAVSQRVQETQPEVSKTEKTLTPTTTHDQLVAVNTPTTQPNSDLITQKTKALTKSSVRNIPRSKTITGKNKVINNPRDIKAENDAIVNFYPNATLTEDGQIYIKVKGYGGHIMREQDRWYYLDQAARNKRIAERDAGMLVETDGVDAKVEVDVTEVVGADIEKRHGGIMDGDSTVNPIISKVPVSNLESVSAAVLPVLPEKKTSTARPATMSMPIIKNTKGALTEITTEKTPSCALKNAVGEGANPELATTETTLSCASKNVVGEGANPELATTTKVPALETPIKEVMHLISTNENDVAMKSEILETVDKEHNSIRNAELEVPGKSDTTNEPAMATEPKLEKPSKGEVNPRYTVVIIDPSEAQGLVRLARLSENGPGDLINYSLFFDSEQPRMVFKLLE